MTVEEMPVLFADSSDAVFRQFVANNGIFVVIHARSPTEAIGLLGERQFFLISMDSAWIPIVEWLAQHRTQYSHALVNLHSSEGIRESVAKKNSELLLLNGFTRVQRESEICQFYITSDSTQLSLHHQDFERDWDQQTRLRKLGL